MHPSSQTPFLVSDKAQHRTLRATTQKRAQHAASLHQDNLPKSSRLLALPSESLTHITAYLDVQALFVLSRVCKALNEHVKDDNTWHSAFNRQFLDDGLETGVTPQADLLLRRVEGSWMKEFVHRSNLLRRWERSRSATVGHIPHHSSIDSMHLLASQGTNLALLTTSLEYGVVARSLPLTGKVMKGFIGASETGLGLGNPNVEFTPNVTACDLITEGNTAKTLWGHANGEVAVSHTNKVMDHLKTTPKLTRCQVEDEHRGRVVMVKWALGGTFFVSAGFDGDVRVWNTKSMRCVWKLQRHDQIPDSPCVRIAFDLVRGAVIAALQNNEVLVWTSVIIPSDDLPPTWPTRTMANPRRLHMPSKVNPPGHSGQERQQCSALFLDHGEIHSDNVVFGIHFEGEEEFYRISVSLTSDQHDMMRYSGGPIGAIRALRVDYRNDGPSIVMVGDQLGRVSFFSWEVPASSTDGDIGLIHPFRVFDAHDDGHITDIGRDACVIVTGSSRGTTHVWDALTLRLVRRFPSPATKPRGGAQWEPVSGIIVDKDLLVVSVGSRIMTWKGGPVGKDRRGTRTVKHSPKAKHGHTTKWIKRLETAMDINESRSTLNDENERAQVNYSRERDQLASLNELGLDEVEAVEYLLMVSRDEEEQRRSKLPPSPPEGIFDGDFDEDLVGEAGQVHHRPTPIPSPSEIITEPVTARTERFSPRRFGVGHASHHSYGSSSKVQVTPPLRPEPMEAGFSGSPLSISSLDSYGRRSHSSFTMTPPSLGDTGQFPTMSSTPSSRSVSSTPQSRSISASPEVKPGSWSQLLKPKITVPASSGSGSGAMSRSGYSSPESAARSWSSRAPSSGPSLLSASLRNHSMGRCVDEDEDDADLKLAIELSLADIESGQKLDEE